MERCKGIDPRRSDDAVRGSDPDLRARAYQELYRVYGKDGHILGQMYQTLVRDWRNEEITLRHFKSPISARNLANDLPDEVIELLLKVAEKNIGIFQRFFKLKANLLGMKKLRRYDIYAPVAKADKPYPYEKAAKKVLCFLHGIRSALRQTGRTRLRGRPPGCRGAQRQTGRRLLCHRHARDDPLGAVQLPGQSG